MSEYPKYKGPITQPCSACSAGDGAMQYHDHDYVDAENRRERRLSERRKGDRRCKNVGWSGRIEAAIALWLIRDELRKLNDRERSKP